MAQYKVHRHVALTALLLYSFSSSIIGQNLIAVKCKATLTSTGRYSSSALYDGDDTIYIFGGLGGMYGGLMADTLKYSISQDKISVAGYHYSGNAAAGAVINNDNNHLFYLPGSNSDSIYQYFPDSQTFTNVSRLQSKNSYYATIKMNDNKALLVGGRLQGYDVLSVDLNTLYSENIHSLTEEAEIAQGIWVEEQGAAYIFYGRGKIQKFNRAANTSEVLPVTMSMSTQQAVWDGRFGYILGRNGTAAYVRDIVQFDPVTESVSYIPVTGYPGSSYKGFRETVAVYADKVNRIYIFGGLYSFTSSNDALIREIYYIDLDSLSPPPTTTDTPTDIATSSTHPTEISSSTPPPTTTECSAASPPFPKFSKAFYQSSLPTWPIAGTVLNLGINASTPEGHPIQYKLESTFDFLSLAPNNHDIIFTSTVSDGAFVGPNNVMLIEVVAEVEGWGESSNSATIAIVFPRAMAMPKRSKML